MVCGSQMRGEKSDLMCKYLPGSAAQPSIGLRGSSLGPAAGLSANLAQPGSHPLFRAQETLQESRHVEVCIELGKVNPETRGTDLNFLKLRGLGVLESLRIAG